MKLNSRPSRAALCLLMGLATACREKAPAPPPAPPQVVVGIVAQRDVPMAREWIGRLDGSTNVEIRARVSGYIDRIDFQEGHLVKKGDPLLRIDTRPLDATLAQAKAEVAKAVATQEKADIDEKRLKPLLASKAVSQQDYDNAVQFNLAAKAGLEAARAVELQAKLNLDYASITSPIDGIVGRTDFSVGDFLSAGSTGAPVTTVSTVDPIKLIFSASEKEYLGAADRIEKMLRIPEAERQKEARSILIRADGKTHPDKGWFVAADREVDAKTGTIRISAYFPNPGNVLRPGQYTRVRIPADEQGKGQIVIPQRAVVELQGKSFVWIVDANNKVSQRPVTTGVLVDSDCVIDDGLKADERIVIEGVQKLRDGMTVKPVEPVKP